MPHRPPRLGRRRPAAMAATAAVAALVLLVACAEQAAGPVEPLEAGGPQGNGVHDAADEAPGTDAAADTNADAASGSGLPECLVAGAGESFVYVEVHPPLPDFEGRARVIFVGHASVLLVVDTPAGSSEIQVGGHPDWVLPVGGGGTVDVVLRANPNGGEFPYGATFTRDGRLELAAWAAPLPALLKMAETDTRLAALAPSFAPRCSSPARHPCLQNQRVANLELVTPAGEGDFDSLGPGEIGHVELPEGRLWVHLGRAFEVTGDEPNACLDFAAGTYVELELGR